MLKLRRLGAEGHKGLFIAGEKGGGHLGLALVHKAAETAVHDPDAQLLGLVAQELLVPQPDAEVLHVQVGTRRHLGELFEALVILPAEEINEVCEKALLQADAV